jgi:CheY-like chemotaxis protein
MPTRILIGEDNPAVRAALHSLLESAGTWEIVDAENGQEAVARAQELKPNLIILDLVMPVMDGLSAARQISKLLPETPLLMYTMHWSRQVELEAQKIGVRKVVSKGDSRLLVSTIQQLLAQEPSPSVSPANETLPPALAIPNTVPPAAILEAGNPTISDQPEAPAAGAKADVPDSGQLS